MRNKQLQYTLTNIRGGKVSVYALDFLGTQFYLRVQSGTQKMVPQNQRACQIKTQLKILLFAPYCLNNTYSFHF